MIRLQKEIEQQNQPPPLKITSPRHNEINSQTPPNGRSNSWQNHTFDDYTTRYAQPPRPHSIPNTIYTNNQTSDQRTVLVSPQMSPSVLGKREHASMYSFADTPPPKPEVNNYTDHSYRRPQTFVDPNYTATFPSPHDVQDLKRMKSNQNSTSPEYAPLPPRSNPRQMQIDAGYNRPAPAEQGEFKLPSISTLLDNTYYSNNTPIREKRVNNKVLDTNTQDTNNQENIDERERHRPYSGYSNRNTLI
jgi:hypothetical protein